MAEEQCPVCKTPVPPHGSGSEGDPAAVGDAAEQRAECANPSCGAKLERREGGAWVLAGEAPAG